jgi:hypothetical protein
MRGLFTRETLSILPGQAVSGVASGARKLRIARGRAWITMEGVSHDYWLTSGDTITAIPGRLIVIEADIACGQVEATIARDPTTLSKLVAQLRALTSRFAARKHAKAGLQQCCSQTM